MTKEQAKQLYETISKLRLSLGYINEELCDIQILLMPLFKENDNQLNLLDF